MKKEKRVIRSWKLVVSGIICIVMLVAMITVQLMVHVDSNALAAQERAGAAARQVSAQLEQAVEDGFRQLRVGSAAIDAGDDSKKSMLESLAQNGSFARVALVRGNVQQEADGTEHPAEAVPSSFISHRAGDVWGKIIVDPDGAIQLRLPIDGSAELVGWMDAAYVGEILVGAYPEDYGYCLYNAATGAYLINRTGYDETRYYDTLLSLNKDGRTSRLMTSAEAQAEISTADGEIWYIAQEAVDIEPWSIALFMPARILDVQPQAGCMPAWLTVVFALLFAAAAMVFVMLLAQRRRGELAQHQARERVRERMLRRAAESAQITFFVYSRSSERIIDRFDGLNPGRSSDAPADSVSALTRSFDIDDTEADRLYDRLREFKGGDDTVLRIKCPAGNGERMLRFELRVIPENRDYVIVSISDCTLESERENTVKAEESFRRAMQAKASSVWEIDGAHNRWRLVSGKTPKGLHALGVNTSGWRDYTADLNGPLRDFMDAGDYAKYVDVMSPSGLTALLREGKGQMTLECRVRDGANAYEWYRLELRIFRSAERGDLMANLFVYNVDAAKNADLERQARARVLQQTLTAIGGIYDGLYYVDLDKNICYTAKSFGSGIASQLSREFKGTFDDYIEQNVHPEDQEEMRRLLSAYQIRRSMTEGSHLQRREYRRRRGDQYQDAAIILQAARFENGTVRDVVIAMRKYAGSTKEM